MVISEQNWIERHRLENQFKKCIDENSNTGNCYHSDEGVKAFMDLSARIVELEKEPYITIHHQRTEYFARANLWRKCPNFRNLIPVNSSQTFDTNVGEIYIPPISFERPDLASKLDYRLVSSEIFSIKDDAYYGDITDIGGRIISAETRGVNDHIIYIYKLKKKIVNFPSLPSWADIAIRAINNGIPLGETESRPPTLYNEHYQAGQGQIANIEELGHVLREDNNYYIILAGGYYYLDDDNRVKKAQRLDTDGWGCHMKLQEKINFHELLKKTLQNHELANKKIFILPKLDSWEDFKNYDGPSYRGLKLATEWLEKKDAKVYVYDKKE